MSGLVGKLVGEGVDLGTEVGAKLYNNPGGEADQAGTAMPRKRRLKLPGTPPQPITKQEAFLNAIVDPAATLLAQENALGDYVKGLPTASDRSVALMKIGVYRQDLAKQAPLLANCDTDMAEDVVTEWFEAGDADLKRLVFNAAAGSEEIALIKAAPPSDGEAALEKMLIEAPDDRRRGQILHKVSHYTQDVMMLKARAADLTPERHAALVKMWLDSDPGETAMKKNILDADMKRSGKSLYGDGVKSLDVVNRHLGNAASHAGSKLHGSEHGTDRATARTVPRAPSGMGAGKHMAGTTRMPGQGNAAEVNPGSGPTDDGGGMRPSIHIRRKGTTGGLGSVAGAGPGAEQPRLGRMKDTPGGVVGGKLSPEDDRARKRRAASKKPLHFGKAEDFDLAMEMVKIAPDEMAEAVGELDPEDQVAVMDEVADYAADLMAWTDQIDPDALAKRDMDAAIEDWLLEDPTLEAIQLKKWTAEALATAEAIPLELATEIMAWEPMEKVDWSNAARGAKSALGRFGRSAREFGSAGKAGWMDAHNETVRAHGGAGNYRRAIAAGTAKSVGTGAAIGAGVGLAGGRKKAKSHSIAGHVGYSALLGPLYGGYRAGRALVAKT